ncbi:MBL fold metallo-hydrolase [Clostridium chromiireducens]|uniref:MBL fold metallo-hydrolase n=1 Tax=Clostridium chromiireducens TaxID=225345 RepID=A0A399IIJ2_9CLOT|nr:MBL fold metallo-hydrolase [Clostridium chromiireducens]RII32770.1 MBL fold metallo-hydrolase [Clostridium chromiireducens]
MTVIYNDLHQFSNYVQPINLTFHQYLLSADDPLLVHTGNIHQAEALIPQLKEALNGKELKYIFISHFEGDECGGLEIILENFPQAKPICSEVTARQLSGFGITDEFVIKRDGERLTTNEYELEFINYPSEMHLWGGLLILENKRNIFFSSDLMFNLGEASGTVVESNWDDEVNNISHEQVPDSNKRAELQQNLLKLNPKFIATGHGQCIKLL